MLFHITDVADAQEEQCIINNLWTHNAQFSSVDLHPLRVTVKTDAGGILGGLIARTWWGGLDIQYLWIEENHRKNGWGRQLMQAAEEEACKRGCHMAYVDTFDFQAVEFYQKLGYRSYGKLPDFAHQHTRHYLAKKLGN